MSDFEEHRQFLIGVAYRMLGSFAEAEDIVQDAFLRWSNTDQAAVEHPRAYLARVVSRLCLDRMKSAAARREQYVGTWLPEPMVAEPNEPFADDLSLALLLTLERLSPLERAAFLLHDVFDMDYSAIADTLERSEAAVRQLATRAREHVREERPRFAATDETRARLTDAFQHAIADGDIATLARLLADDAVFYSDGGGKRLAALNPIYGKEKIVRFFIGISSKRPVIERVDHVQINGLPGFVFHTDEGVETLAFDIAGEQVVAIYAIRNPDKLRHLA
ncbi:MAG TPA: sigma-70 family RNA polymerase sigma factor [Kofleriaceae bacterium]|nr:sigma-70 family RNA polymerase sigma factor [Kofleriaceae bacterium]